MRQIICVFSDESGVFNRNNNRFFVFGGLILNASNPIDLDCIHPSQGFQEQANMPKISGLCLFGRFGLCIFLPDLKWIPLL